MSETTEYIEHSAIIKKIDTDHNLVWVRIDDPEECGDCPASKLCQSRGEPSNLVSVKVTDTRRYKVDDIVTVRGTERMHHKAIMYATVFPCIILIATMVGIYLLTDNQLAAALSGIGMTGIFYLILWLFRNKIAHEFTFTLVGQPERTGEIK